MEKVKTTKKGGTKIASLEEVKEAALMIQLNSNSNEEKLKE